MRVVVPSVNAGDFLATTLPAWRALLPRADITVVTAHTDTETQCVAAAVPKVKVHVTEAWQAEGAIFNKGRALDEAYGFGKPSGPEDGEVCLTLDADVYPFGKFPREHRVDEQTLYGTARYYAPTPEVLRAHIAGETERYDLPLIFQRYRGTPAPEIQRATERQARRVGRLAIGFVQLFRYRAGVEYGYSRTAGGVDIWFRRHFKRRDHIPNFYVLHLGELDRRNWRGRVVPRWNA